jgi:hypothetical protein
MGENTRLENVTLNLASINNVNLTGVRFPGTTSTTAKMRVCILNITNTSPGGGTPNTYGVHASGTTTNPTVLLSTNAIQRCTINVTANVGTARALYVDGACQFAVRDSVYFANQGSGGSSTDIIGVEVANTGAFVSLKTSTVSGYTGGADIKQASLGLTGTNPVLQLTATDLVNANSINGFGTNIESNQLFYVVIGAGGNISNNSYYLSPGNVTANSLSTSVLSIPLSQKLIIYSCTIYVSSIPTGRSITINLYNSTNSAVQGTQIATTKLTHTNTGPIRIQNFASTFVPNVNYLQVVMITEGGNFALGNVYTTISFY